MWQSSPARAQLTRKPTRALIVPGTVARSADGEPARPETDRESRLSHTCQNVKDENGRPAESETVHVAGRHACLHEPMRRQASFLGNTRGGRHAPGPDPKEGGGHRTASANRDHGATAFGKEVRFARGQPMTRTCLITHTPLKRHQASRHSWPY